MIYKNPYGVANGKVVYIENYSKEMGNVTCPVCKEELVYCSGVGVKSHFRHLSDKYHSSEKWKTAVESLKHKEMKQKLIEEKSIPLRYCRWCREIEQERLKDYNVWEEEVKWNYKEDGRYFGTNYVIDVVAVAVATAAAVANEEGRKMFIEVVNTHKCSDEKYKAFEKSGVDWMEIDCDGKYLCGNYVCSECDSNRLTFGKYKGMMINELLVKDRRYCSWLVKSCDHVKNNIKIMQILNKEFPEVGLANKYINICNIIRDGPKELIKLREELKIGFESHYLYSRLNGISKGKIEELRILTVGKYKGENVYNIKDKQYLRWLLDNIDDICGRSMSNEKFFIVDALLC